jgi:hypothetical protein
MASSTDQVMKENSIKTGFHNFLFQLYTQVVVFAQAPFQQHPAKI